MSPQPFRNSFDVMGTHASLVMVAARSRPGPAAGDGEPRALDRVAREIGRVLQGVEARFSPYRETSELSSYRRGEITEHDLSSQMREVMAACRTLQEQTEGDFHPIDPQGRFDPSAYVKGWAVERAVRRAVSVGVQDVCLNVGGDVKAIGRPKPDRPWRVAIQNPAAPRGITAIIEPPPGRDELAVATSGISQRGAHIWRRDGRAAVENQENPDLGRASVTVVGPDLGWADGYSTAAWSRLTSRGAAGVVEMVQGFSGYECLVVTEDEMLLASDGMDAMLV